ncbi:Lrp/AsnC family transcriptional regulator [Planctomonas sp. JC2975]|uniref:Lrp/AsnC family transcriptional regulator n=1 Tax=Planctomonas sp. JC2975 TaxID=2729626 RepID=UPI0014745FD6|nr:Lrp/AsnC family transcriptional regulator [Planctomonas sp. JC2975]NNC10469.1 Lrp/AsnC family transcriptional regulator [Planctomonas sp. JC2975]
MSESKVPELDPVDRALVLALSSNARISGAALAAEAGVAESTVSLRLRNLQRRGVIAGYRLDVDLKAAGIPLQAMIAVRLAKHSRAQIDAFRAAAPHLPGVIALFHTAGADDYLLHVAARDAGELRDFVLDHLTGNPAVAHTETSLIFENAAGDGWQQLLDGP